MLSEKQTALVVRQVNEDLNLPFIGEDSEGALIAKFVDRIVPQIEPALSAILPLVYVECIKIALDESMPSSDRRKAIYERMQGELTEPLARELNARVDSSVLPEQVEGQALTIAASKIIKEFVEWTVGEVQNRLDQEYAEAGM